MRLKNRIQLLLVLLVSSCNLDIAPENLMVDQTVYKDEKTANAALLGVYNRFNASLSGAPTGVNNYSNTGIPYLFAEVGTTTLFTRENSSYISMESAKYTEGDQNGYILTTWNNIYNAIDYANSVIEGINKYGDYDVQIMKQHIAEAKFLRGYLYLTLLQMYGDGALIGNESGDGVILRLTPYTGHNPDDGEYRASVGKSYDQIITDLTDALPFLNNNSVASGIEPRTRATKTAAFALLSRVYLYRGTFNNNTSYLKLAGDYADSVLVNATAKGYSFTTNSSYIASMFPKNTTSDETNPTTMNNEVILLEPSYSSLIKYPNGLGVYHKKADFYADPNYILSFDAGDLRGRVEGNIKSLIWDGSITDSNGSYTTAKYNNGNGFNCVLYLRLAEAKLTKAEVKVRLTNSVDDEAIGLLNDTYRRSFDAPVPVAFTAADFATPQALLNKILDDRLRELAFEGHTRYDFIRTKRPLRISSLADNKKNLPIPDYDVKRSYGRIKQNSGF